MTLQVLGIILKYHIDSRRAGSDASTTLRVANATPSSRFKRAGTRPRVRDYSENGLLRLGMRGSSAPILTDGKLDYFSEFFGGQAVAGIGGARGATFEASLSRPGSSDPGRRPALPLDAGVGQLSGEQGL